MKSQTTFNAKLESECPQDGTCTIEILENKSIDVKQDEFGSIYYTIEENLNKKVIKYIYKRTVKEDLQDAGYREEIVFEIDVNLKNKTFLNDEIQETKMLFGRFCFCRGQTGNYKVNNGRLVINDNSISLDFKTTKVPQVIKNISISLK
jgi:hypothetical protein